MVNRQPLYTYTILMLIFYFGYGDNIAALNFKAITQKKSDKYGTSRDLKNDHKLQAPLFNDIGNLHFPISTNVPLAQRFFDQGLFFYTDFFYAEAIRSYKEATRLDPSCAMCYWGLALALGKENYLPKPEIEIIEGYQAIQKAKKLVDPKNTIEKAYIDALYEQYSYLHNSKNGDLPSLQEKVIPEKNLQEYADAMKKLTEKFPHDLIAKYLYATALMDVSHWKFYDSKGKPTPIAIEMLKTLNDMLAIDPKNISANHIKIHVLEESSHPENALPNAEILEKYSPPLADHLFHMPSHVYMLTGEYHKVVTANQKSIAAFKNYQNQTRAQGFEPELNDEFNHDLHMLWFAAMMEGNYALSIKTTRELMKQIPLTWLDKIKYLQLYLPTPYLTEVRFGKWEEILKEPKPDAEFPYALGLWHYARGIAFAKLNKTKASEGEYKELQNVIQKSAVPTNLSNADYQQLKVAAKILKAVIADVNHRDEEMIDELTAAVNMQDAMEVHTPSTWYFSIREALGYALMKTHQPQKAEIEFRRSLKDKIKSGWALYGLWLSLLKQGKLQEAARVEKEYKEAWKYADIKKPFILFN